MPAFSTHYAFACRCAGLVQSHCGFLPDKNALMVGTQGPDIFFFHRILPVLMPGHSLRKTGSALHRAKPGDIFDAAAQHIRKSKEKEISLSYFYGFILHYALDRCCHPYVYAKQRELETVYPRLHPFTLHNEVELALDAYVLSKVLHEKAPADFQPALTFFTNARMLNAVETCIQAILKNACGYMLPKGAAVQAIADTRTAQRMLHDKSGCKRTLAVQAEKALLPLTGGLKLSVMIRPATAQSGAAYANEQHVCWRSPWQPDVPRRESFLDLFYAAQTDAAELLDGFDAVLRGEACGSEITQNRSFLTGVEVK